MNKRRRSLILIRGLPGSGKSTLAKLLAEDGRYPVFSVDDYFYDSSGNYVFNFSENHRAYDQCKKNVRQAMEEGISKIFVDNTFTLDWEMEPYFELAEEFNYVIFVFTVENYHGNENVHGISQEQIRKMASKYKVQLMPGGL